MSNTIFIAEKTAKGLPAMWESGGGLTNTGKSIIVCGANFEPLVPVYLRQKGMLSCANHALFVIEPGYHIIEADHHREDFDIVIHKIVGFDDGMFLKLKCDVIGRFMNGEWHNIKFMEKNSLGEIVDNKTWSLAVDAAIKKATMYHCREMVFGVKNG